MTRHRFFTAASLLILAAWPVAGTMAGIANAAPMDLTAPTPVPVTAAITPIVSSPVSGVTFADAPRLLPIDSRFSQAIQTVGIDLGLSCQQIEAYGWTIAASEQSRVNDIFTNTAQELSRLGYAVQPQSPGSAAADITVYTATKPDKTVLFTWSAGNAGLLLLLCDARGDIVKQGFGPAPGTVDYPVTAMTTDANDQPQAEPEPTPIGKPTDIIGEYPGTYSCVSQGPAGGTLTISRVRADKAGYSVGGIFSFYPLPDKNRGMVSGSYRLSGRYDPISRRALLEPTSWIERPAGFTNAPLIAEFPATMTMGETPRVSALFQGTTGCTSFEGSLRTNSEARAAAKAYDEPVPAPVASKINAPKKRKAIAKKPALSKSAQPASLTPVASPATATAPGALPVATTTVITTITPPAAVDPTGNVPGSTAATTPTAPATPTVTTVTTTSEAPAKGSPMPTVPATPAPSTEAPVTIPPAPPAAQ